MRTCQSTGIMPPMASYYHLPFFIFSCDVTGEYHPSILHAVPLIEILGEFKAGKKKKSASNRGPQLIW